ncbi:hypothetical protein RAM80_06360 [Pseudomonas sp. App30]|uniref:hypothetical protein n=1 Tax=Pseudomonas sp. App30 TaxID=3068990 RepID=UPI003A803AE7
MRRLAIRRRHLNVAFDTKVLRDVKPVSFVIDVMDEQVPLFNRQSRVARTSAGWPLESSPLPMLMDVT